MDKITVEIVDAKCLARSIASFYDVSPTETVYSLKKRLEKKGLYGTERIALRSEPKGKGLRDETLLSSLNLPAKNAQIYFKDLGPQIGWKTVFLFEYAGPLLVYPIFYFRPHFIYGLSKKPVELGVTLALICHSLHYAKRLLETEFIHRFSNGTMPLKNLFKNCSYYWGFAAFMSYFINHPLYTRPTFGSTQIYFGLAGFLVCELGNLSIHLLLRNLRPAGTKERKVPYPNSNPLTLLFNFVSCPNYTYEVFAWISFAVMTQCLPVLIFTLAGFLQMKIWAAGKHRAYKKEFSAYPKNRRPIIPFVC